MSQGTPRWREFRFAVCRDRRFARDDGSLRRDEFMEADRWTEFRGAMLVPLDPAWALGECEEPDWSFGAVLRDVASGRVLHDWEFEGRPPRALVEAWLESRLVDGVLIFSSGVRHRRGEE